MKIGIAQIAPVWLDKMKTIEKVARYVEDAAIQGCKLVVFGEALIPGYPFWLSATHGASFNDPMQKALHAHYLEQGVDLEAGDLDSICEVAKTKEIAVYVGVMERPMDRGGHSLYCTLVFIDANGTIQSAHRKLQPTYEERLCWAPGDGHGLVTHQVEEFVVGGLNCWENWMPLSRTALYAQGENLHVGVWPGGDHNTHDLPLFIAKEGRCFSAHSCGLLRKSDIDPSLPYADLILEEAKDYLANGGSCLAGPDGTWIIPPQIGEEGLWTAEIALNEVYKDRQNFDPAGHYSRPDVTQLTVNRSRQSILNIKNED